MSGDTNELVLIDGYSLAYRAYYALPRFTTKGGKPTGAIYGFINMLWKIIENCKPSGVVVAADAPRPTFRHKIMVQYKAQRKPMPDDMKPQIADIKELIDLLGMNWVEEEGYEADDLIGSIVAERQTRKHMAIVTSDRDLLQLVGKKTVVLRPVKGISTMKRIDEALLREELGISPSQVVDLVSMAGDASDNIQGLAGVGEKTAARLLNRYGNWESICSHIEEISPRIRRSIEDGKDLVEENRRLVAIFTGLRPVLQEEWNPGKIQWEDFFKKLDDLEFRKLAERLKKKTIRMFSEERERGNARGGNTKSNHRVSSSGEKKFLLLAHPFPRSREALKQAMESGSGNFFSLETALFVTHPCELPRWRETVGKTLEQNAAGEPFFLIVQEHLERHFSLERSLREIEFPLLRALLLDGCAISGLPLYTSFPLPGEMSAAGSVYADLPLFAQEGEYTIKVLEPDFPETMVDSESSLRGAVTTFYGPRFLGNTGTTSSLRKAACCQEVLRILCMVLFTQGVKQIRLRPREIRFSPPDKNRAARCITAAVQRTGELLGSTYSLEILQELKDVWTIGLCWAGEESVPWTLS